MTKLSDPATRVTRIVEGLFAGNCTKMAGAIGCDPSLLTRIIKGEREPGRALLEKISKIPAVNPTWVFAGDGEPYRGTHGKTKQDGFALPVAKVLFEGGPSDNEPCLSGEMAVVAQASFRPTRYWLRVERDETEQLTELRFHVGDMLLMESAASNRASVAHAHNRVCIYRDTPSNTLQLGYVVHDLDHEDSSQPLYVIRLVLLQATEDHAMTVKSASKRRSQLRWPSPWANIGIKNVVAISLSLARQFDSGISVNLLRLKGTKKK